MRHLQLTDDLLTGVKEVDDQHRRLFECADLVMHEPQAGQPAVLSRALVFLAGYTRFHFASEEHAMASWGYPDLEAHARQHALFRREVEALQSGVTTTGITPEARARLHWLFREWLRQHIATSDRKLAAFFAAHPRPVPGPVLPDADRLRADGVDLGPDLPPELQKASAADIEVRVRPVPGQVSPSEARARNRVR